MAEKPTLSVLRNAIEDIYRRMMREQDNGEVSNAAVLSRVRITMAAELDLLTPRLLDIALTKLLNEVSYRRGSARTKSVRDDLFGKYHIPNRVTIIRGSKKDTSKLSVLEFRQYLDAREKRAANDHFAYYRQFLEDHREFVKSDDDTLEIIVLRKRQAEELAVR